MLDVAGCLDEAGLFDQSAAGVDPASLVLHVDLLVSRFRVEPASSVK